MVLLQDRKLKSPAIVWFRHNLRIRDNAALIAAAESGSPIIAVFIHQDAGGASNWWLHHSLVALDKALADLGGSLHILNGPAHKLLAKIARDAKAGSIFFQRQYEPKSRKDERRLKKALDDDLDIHGFHDSLLNLPGSVMTKSGTPYKIFTPYWNASVRLGEPEVPKPAPSKLAFADVNFRSMSIDDLKLLPSSPDWSGGLQDAWRPGEPGAHDQLDVATNIAADYDEKRDRPDLDATSRLSPYLHFGELSARQVWHSIKSASTRAAASTGVEALLRQLFWRDFSAYLLYHFPDLPSKPLRPEFEHFPWSNDQQLLEAWQRGQTGIPLVDAGMRQLWATGWMHNRVRMIVASFLVKNLMIDWQTGADWFLDTLVDADLANNSAGWQWVAGCGTDAAPYFRIFNPVLQSAKFDPDGNYIRRWVPELSEMPTKHIHEPWKADNEIQEAANVVDGRDYPMPIVDLGQTRQAALDAYKMIKSTP
ncbi:MAG: deoxyribodipyrimidine photo-lyase [Woeseiaceae bacterium]|nr:deoxyribodipyrimidine photo-lyase [Woeseiaceae bacterium]